MTYKLKPNQIGFFNAITGQVVTPVEWQLELKPGDYYIIEQPDIGLLDRAGRAVERDIGPTVYGRIETGEDTPGFGYFWCAATQPGAPTASWG